YIQKGDEWVMERVECGSPCTAVTVLHDLAPPPFPDIPAWLASPTHPDWVMGVTVPNDPEELDLSTNARRILVTIDGGGNVEGAGGGTNNISLTAGGTTTSEIEADEFNVPSFVRANSRCGGPVALIVDDSGSIGSDVGIVEDGVQAFIEAFRGTPTQLQVIPFSSEAHSMGSGSTWARVVDMTDDAAVTSLRNDVDAELVANGGTNWEDAFFRAFHNSDGSEADTKPNRIVFFTDGIVTRDRTSGSSYRSGPLMHYNAGEYNHSIWNSATGSHFSQESWDRTDAMLANFDRGADFEMIVVGVGQGLTQTLQNKSGYWPQGKWRQNTAAYDNPSAPVGPTIDMTGSETLARLLGAGGSAVEAIYDEGAMEFTNPDTADFYNIADFDLDSFGAAMKAAALKDCGGTVTIQTKLTDGTNVPEEFIYENTEYRDHTGTAVPAESRRVTTSAAFRTGTFDFEIPSTSDYFTVDIVPQELQTLQGFTFQNWTCKAGGVNKFPDGIDDIIIDGSTYQGISVDVLPNEAVSCIVTVSQP
ncbi:MAG: vWA domain-containing protein, partial [Ilumatobacteraceae bacterium]